MNVSLIEKYYTTSSTLSLGLYIENCFELKFKCFYQIENS